MADLIDRQAAIDALAKHEKSNGHNYTLFVDIVSECAEIIRDLPSAQPDRDTPKKPKEITDRTWGIPRRQAVCPNCGCYLVTAYFIYEGGGKRRDSYCDSCGQAIDWKGWENND